MTSETTSDITIYEAIDREFPTAPFSVSCFESLEDIDTIMTLEPVIFIYDDRAHEDNYYYTDMPDISMYRNYTKVVKGNTPITYRDTINAMIADPHYSSDLVKGDPHIFLEGFVRSSSSPIQYSCLWGS